MDKLHIEVTNTLTGEISSVDVKSAEQAKNLLVEFKASQLAIKKAEERLKDYLDVFLGNDEQHQFPDGKILRRVQRSTLIYQVSSLRSIGLDEDQIALVSQVNTTAANALIGEMIERNELPGSSLKQVREEAEHKASKPYVEVR